MIAISLISFNYSGILHAQDVKDTDPALSSRQTAIVRIAALTAKGDLLHLKEAMNEALDESLGEEIQNDEIPDEELNDDNIDTGLTVNEIKEILIQMYAYCGFPRSLNGISVLKSVLEERQKKGIKDVIGDDASPLPADKTSIELGTEILEELTGTPASPVKNSFVPAIDNFLRGHLFGDIFGRDTLDFQSREIATISALSSMEGVAPQLQGHIDVGFNVGLSESQIRNIISILESKVGKKEAANAEEALAKVLTAKAKKNSSKSQ